MRDGDKKAMKLSSVFTQECHIKLKIYGSTMVFTENTIQSLFNKYRD